MKRVAIEAIVGHPTVLEQSLQPLPGNTPPLSDVFCRKILKCGYHRTDSHNLPAIAMAHISSADSFAPLHRVSSRFAALQVIESQLIRCDIVFGMPSQDCRGTGICKLTSDYDAPLNLKNDCRNTVAFAGRAGEGMQVTLVFFRELLCANLYSRHFRKGALELTESCPLPSGLVKTLKLKGKTILPGRYHVVEQDGCFQVSVSVRQD